MLPAMNSLHALITSATLCAAAFAQPTSNSVLAPPSNGPRRADPTWVALTDVTAHVSPTSTIAHATIIFRDGKIQAVLPPERLAEDQAQPDSPRDEQGPVKPARLPMGPRVVQGTGLHAYPGFIEPALEVDAPAPSRPAGAGKHWNQQVNPQRSALDGSGVDARTAESLRKLGFAAACITPKGGIFRGSSSLVSLAKPADDASAQKPPVYRENIYQFIAMDPSGGGYPDSQMGAIALIRQTFIDADWLATQTESARTEPINALDYVPAQTGRTSQLAAPLCLINADDELDALRSAKLLREFTRSGIILGSGLEYQRLAAIKADGLTHLIPLNFPKAPDVSSFSKSEAVDLREMMAWEQAPTNPRRLAAAGVRFALTTAKLKDRNDFLANLRLTLQAGLAPEQAMAALTTIPAEILGVADQLGTLEPGKRANIVLTDKPLFDLKLGKDAKVRDVIVDGVRHEINAPALDVAGEWDVTIQPLAPTNPKADDDKAPPAPPPAPDKRWLTLTNDRKITIHKNDKKVDADKVSIANNQIAFVFDHEPLDGTQGVYTASAVILNDAAGRPASISGTLLRTTGERLNFIAVRRQSAPSLEGIWPIVFDLPDPNLKNSRVGPVLVIDDKNVPTLFTPADKGLDAAPLDDVKIEGSVLRYSVAMPGTKIPVELKFDFNATPPTARGIVRASINGKPKTFAFAATKASFEGTWRVSEFDGTKKDPADKDQFELKITKDSVTLTSKRPEGGTGEPIVIKADEVKIAGPRLTFTHPLEKLGGQGSSSDVITIAGSLNAAGEPSFQLQGTSTLSNPDKPEKATHTYTAIKPGSEDDATSRFKDLAEQLPLPFGPYGFAEYPAPRSAAFTNASIWPGTGKPIEKGTIIIADGAITAVGGADLAIPAGTTVVDCQGKHITAGIIDCHSHTGISRGVNEAGMAVTSQVRIADVTNPDDINWYRQLAGGVTAVNSLHGSANSIGGQSQTNKLRWGSPNLDDMHMDGAKPGIKFALGENPRRANRSSSENTRYPNTRMGVETQIRDRFIAAKEYAADITDATAPGDNLPNLTDAQKARAAELRKTIDEARRSLTKPDASTDAKNDARARINAANTELLPLTKHAATPPRRDLQLEPLAEILAGKRIVHCHSYRQDEIVMLCEVARDFNFKIGTFQHILEGYKVADFVRDYSGGGSGFSDWWAFKVEVQDAIPQGLPLMHEVGAVVSFNSDSNELARRLNTEAAKAIKYDGANIPDWQAWNFVTLNPAKQLQIDKDTGSIEVGKNADLAIWSGPPMSSLARCEATYVDGRELFSLAQDAAHRATIAKERQRLIQKLLTANKKGDKADAKADAKGDDTASPSGRRRRGGPPPQSALERLYFDLHNRGIIDPNDQPGVCGCGWH